MKFKQLALCVLLLLCGSGCVRTYSPKMTDEFGPINEFKSNGSVSLLNGQPSAEAYTFGTGTMQTYTLNLNQCTDVTIQLADRELTKRGVHIDNSLPKSITMSVTSCRTDTGMLTIDTTVDLLVRTGDGYSHLYHGKNSANFVAFYQGQLDLIMSRAVAEMLNDPNIVAYLNK